MSRARTFSKAEIRDAAKAAAESGLSVRLLPTGEMEFNQSASRREHAKPTPEEALEAWLNDNKVGRRAHR
jgi:hypothetical protein